MIQPSPEAQEPLRENIHLTEIELVREKWPFPGQFVLKAVNCWGIAGIPAHLDLDFENP